MAKITVVKIWLYFSAVVFVVIVGNINRFLALADEIRGSVLRRLHGESGLEFWQQICLTVLLYHETPVEEQLLNRSQPLNIAKDPLASSETKV